MNAGRYRLVFDALRGMLVAVGEQTASRRKGRASLVRGSLASAIARGGRFATRPIAFAAWCAFVWQPGAADAQATLPLSPDRSPGATGPRPAIGVAANGVPIVHVVKPNAAGVSHNRFAQYNVGTAGMVLNNSGLPSTTQTAGWVGGNPFLGNGHARVILNEVTSGNPSRLLGMTEVAGRAANVVVANPAGIYCNGCGFINVPRATLAAGVPVVNGFGALASLDVMQGALTVDGQGLDARASSQLDLIARAMRINGAIWAQRIDAVAGANRVDYQHGDAAPLDGRGHPPPIVAIDVAALGGMYANSVRLVSSERGVGVHLGGTVNSLTGDIRLSSTGDVTIAQHGSVLAAGNAKLDAASLRHAGAIAANGEVALLTSNAVDIDLGGTVTSRTDVMGAAQTISNRGMIAVVGAERPGNVTLTAASTLRNGGTIDARKDVTLRATTADLSGGTMRAGNRAALTVAGDIGHAQATLDADAFDVKAGGTFDNRRGRLAGRLPSTLASGALNNNEGIVSSQSTLMAESAVVQNRDGRLIAEGDFDVRATSVENVRGVLGSVAGVATVTVSGALDNRQGTVSSEKKVKVTAARLDNDGGRVTARANVDVESAGELTNRGGTLGANGDVKLKADAVANDEGLLHAGGTLEIESNRVTNSNTRAIDKGIEGARVTIQSDTLNNVDGAIRSDVQAELNVGSLDNTRGTVESTGKARVRAERDVTNRGGDFNGASGLDIDARSMSGDGTAQSAGDVDISLHTDFDHTGTTRAEGKLTFRTSGDVKNSGSMTAGKDAEVSARNIDNRASGVIVGESGTRVRAAERLTNDGLLNGGDTRIDAPHTHNTGRIFGDAVGVNGDTLTNGMNEQGVAGTLASRNDMDFGVDTLTNRDGGFIYAQRDLRLGRALDENGHATGEAELVTNDGGTIESGGNAQYRARRIDNLNSRFASTVKTTTEAMAKRFYARRGSSELMPGESTWFYHVNNNDLENGAQNIRALIRRDYSWYLVGPSSTYPQARFGPPFDFDGTHGGVRSGGIHLKGRAATGMGMVAGMVTAYGSAPVGLAYVPSNSRTDPMGEVASLPERFGYSREDKIWSVFGIAPPQAPLPEAPVNRCVGPNIACRTGFLEQQRAYDAKHEAYVAPYRALNSAIRAFNRDFRSRLVQAFTAYEFTSGTRTEDTVTASAPGRLIAGGALSTTGVVNNDKSQIVAGGDYNGHGPQTINGAALGTRTTIGRGTATYTHKRRHRDWLTPRPVEHVLERETIQLPIMPSSPNAAAVAIRSVPAASDAARGAGAAVDVVRGAGPSIAGGELNLVDGDASLGHLPAARLGAQVIRTIPPSAMLPNNALYRSVADPGSRYLIETDPAYTQFNRWISSDTMLQAMSVEPEAVLKRIGDGFYEQQLVTQQVMTLTGQRFVGDYRDNQTQYAALLKNGAQAASTFNLTVGTALSEVQMGALSNDIVWLVKQTVTLPDGRTEEVLAPQVYLRAGAADVTGEGTLLAARNVSIESSGEVRNLGTIASRDVTTIDAQNVRNVHGTLAGKTLVARAKVDFEHLAGQIVADHVLLGAGRDVTIGSETWSMSTASNRTTGIGALGAIEAGTMGVFAGRDLSVNAAALAAREEMRLAAGRDLNLGTERTGDSERVTWDRRNNRSTTSSVDVGSRLRAGGEMSMAAGRDVVATSAYLSAGKALTVAAGRNVELNAGAASQSLEENHYSESRGFLSKKQTTTRDRVASTQALGTTLSGETVTVAAGGNLRAHAATIAGTDDVTLAAGNDLMIGAAQTSSSEYHFKDEKRSGFGVMGGFSYGTTQTKDTSNDAVHGAQGSLIGSTDGSVYMQAGNDLHVTGSDLVAARDIVGAGANVTVDASQTQRHHDRAHEVKTSGFTLAVKSSVLDAIQNARNQGEASGQSRDGRASALHAMAAAGSAVDALGGAGAIANGGKPDVKVELSWGTSSSKSTFSEDQTQHNGSNLKAGGTVALAATGNGSTGSGDVAIAGSTVSADNVILQAAHQVDLRHSTDTDSTRSTNESSSASVGVSYGSQGFGVSASMAKAHGDANSDAVTRNNTHVNAANKVVIQSGGDTNLVGANVTANRVVADVGGNLNIESVQDTSQSAMHQESSGGGFSVSQGGGSASFFSQSGSASASYAGVNEQSGIHAGDDGFQINVAGNTGLKGAFIASDADASKNVLTTGTLTFSDIENSSSYEAQSSGFGVGGGFGDASAEKTTGPRSVKNAGGLTPMLSQSDSGRDSATTRSAVSQGTITLTDEANQRQALSDLRREATALNDTVAQAPDLTQVLEQQADMMNAVQAAGQAVARRIGNYADSKKKAALDASKQAEREGNPELAARYRQDAKDWGEGGKYRVRMHAAGMAAVTGLGGGNALGGGAGAVVLAVGANGVDALSDAVADANPTGDADVNRALGNILANVVAVGAGATAGGNSGAVAAANVDLYNRQLHPDERKWIEDHAADYANQQGISVAEAVNELTAQANRQVQNGSPGAWDQNASAFLDQAHGMLPADGNSGPGYMFYATPAQKADGNMYAGYYSNGVGLNMPSASAITTSANKDQANRNLMGAGVIAGATGAVLLVGGPVAASVGGLGYAAIGGVTGGGMDAAGQYGQSGTVRPVETGFAAMTGALAGPVGANVGFMSNVLLGSATGSLNTAFNNIYYGESNSLSYSGALGALGGTVGYGIGMLTTRGLGQILKPFIYENLNSTMPVLLQPRVPNPVPGLAGATSGGIASGTTSFVPSQPAQK